MKNDFRMVIKTEDVVEEIKGCVNSACDMVEKGKIDVAKTYASMAFNSFEFLMCYALKENKDFSTNYDFLFEACNLDKIAYLM